MKIMLDKEILDVICFLFFFKQLIKSYIQLIIKQDLSVNNKFIMGKYLRPVRPSLNRQNKLHIQPRLLRQLKQQRGYKKQLQTSTWSQKYSRSCPCCVNPQNKSSKQKRAYIRKISEDTTIVTAKNKINNDPKINQIRKKINLKNIRKMKTLKKQPRMKKLISKKATVVKPEQLQKSLSLNSAAYIVCDHQLNVIAGSNVKCSMPMASITKLLNLLTCLQVMKEYQLQFQKVVEIPQLTNRREQSSAKLLKGDKMTLRNLLYAMILPSGNDAAEAIALILGGLLKRSKDSKQHRQAYLERMKKYGQKIGMKKTLLLDEKGYALNTSTPFQITLLLKQVNGDRDALEFLKPQSVRAEVTDINGKTRGCSWTTTNLLLQEGYYGKTGHAKNRTFSFAAIKHYKESPYYICVLGSASQTGRFSDAKYLLKHAVRK